MSIDLTDRFHQFRAAARQLADTGALDEDVVALFRALVMYPLPADAAAIPGSAEGPGEVLEHYLVRPTTPRIPAMISSDVPAAGTWDHPVTALDACEVDLRLISVFDWESGGPREFRFLRVRIVHAGDPDLTGRDALLDADECRVEYVG